jgi:hypothetical protein
MTLNSDEMRQHYEDFLEQRSEISSKGRGLPITLEGEDRFAFICSSGYFGILFPARYETLKYLKTRIELEIIGTYFDKKKNKHIPRKDPANFWVCNGGFGKKEIILSWKHSLNGKDVCTLEEIMQEGL